MGRARLVQKVHRWCRQLKSSIERIDINVTAWRVHVSTTVGGTSATLSLSFFRTSGVFFTRPPHVHHPHASLYWPVWLFDKSTVHDDNMIGGFEEVVTLYRLRRNYLFRDDASGFACRPASTTMRCGILDTRVKRLAKPNRVS